jgi:hypothetical protein
MPYRVVEDFNDLTGGLQSLVTAGALIIGAIWAYWKFVLQGERHAHIETSAEIEFVDFQDNSWIVELRAVLTNKGKVEHRLAQFGFDLAALFRDDPVETSTNWGGQVDFPHEIARGSFLPSSFKFFVVGPGVTARYSFVAKVPREANSLMLHCRFSYMDRATFGHSMERTAKVPTPPRAAAGQARGKGRARQSDPAQRQS